MRRDLVNLRRAGSIGRRTISRWGGAGGGVPVAAGLAVAPVAAVAVAGAFG
jgi:hypothetical protein